MKKEILEKVLNVRKNIMISGDIATGKSSNVVSPIINEIINNKESLLILDTKEEYIKEYYRKLKDNEYKIEILNLRDLTKSDSWNPLEYPYKLYKQGKIDRTIDYLDMLGKVIFEDNGSQDPFWSNSASDYFTGIVLGLFEDGTKEQINFASINLMMVLGEERFGGPKNNYMKEYINSKDPARLVYVNASGTVFAPEETRGGILSIARQKMKAIVTRENLMQILCNTTIDIENMGKNPTAIFVIAKDENKAINNVATIFIEQIYQILVGKKEITHFNFVIDNIETIDKINELSNMLSSCISRKMKFYLSTRSLNNFNEQYGSYINHLIYHIKVNDHFIEFGDDDKIDNIKEVKNETFDEIEYPKLEKKEIGIFDIRKYVKEFKKKKMYSMLEEENNNTLKKDINPFDSSVSSFNKENNDDIFSVDSLIKKIDDKIEELNREEEREKIQNTKSRLEQFKI